MLCETTETVQRCADIHGSTPVCTAALGRLMTGTSMMGIMMKGEEENVTVTIKGDGPMGTLVAVANHGKLRCCADNPKVELPLRADGKLDVGGSLGIGELSVIRDLGLKEPYMGTIALVNGEIAEDLTAYFFISEQQNTSVALGVKVERDLSIGAAGGMIIQMLPNAEEGAVDALEEMIGKMEPVTTTISRITSESKGMTETALVHRMVSEIFAEMPQEYQVRILKDRDITWHCDCSRQRIEQALMAIGTKDLQEIIEEDGQAELQCQFCLKKYHFNKEELQAILEDIK